jgi:ribosomal protein S26
MISEDTPKDQVVNHKHMVYENVTRDIRKNSDVLVVAQIKHGLRFCNPCLLWGYIIRMGCFREIREVRENREGEKH